MITINCVMDLLKRMTPIMKSNTESAAECCSVGASGLIEDIWPPEVATMVAEERALISEAEELLALFESQLNNPPPGYFNNDYYTG